MNIYYVYVYYDPRKSPPEPIYVGKGKGKRASHHLRKSCTNSIFRRKLDKIHKAGLFPIIEKVEENLSNERAIELEVELIARYGRIHNKTGTLCNFTDGGEGTEGYKHRESTLELFSEQRKGKKQTPAQYAANCNRVISDETRRKRSIANKGHRRHTPEQIERLRQFNLGRKHSDATRKLQSQQRKGKKQTPAQYAANCNRVVKRRQVQCSNGMTFKDAHEAASFFNSSYSMIISVCNGSRKTCKGHIFTWVLDQSGNHQFSIEDRSSHQ